MDSKHLKRLVEVFHLLMFNLLLKLADYCFCGLVRGLDICEGHAALEFGSQGFEDMQRLKALADDSFSRLFNQRSQSLMLGTNFLL